MPANLELKTEYAMAEEHVLVEGAGMMTRRTRGVRLSRRNGRDRRVHCGFERDVDGMVIGGDRLPVDEQSARRLGPVDPFARRMAVDRRKDVGEHLHDVADVAG